MSNIDPYLEWLHIPADRRPPTYYDLLGLEPFENDPAEVQRRAIERMEHVRRFRMGPRGELSTKISNELSQAFDCLSNPERKAAYDRQLRGGETQNGAGETVCVVPEEASRPPAIKPRAVDAELPPPPVRLAPQERVKIVAASRRQWDRSEGEIGEVAAAREAPQFSGRYEAGRQALADLEARAEGDLLVATEAVPPARPQGRRRNRPAKSGRPAPGLGLVVLGASIAAGVFLLLLVTNRAWRGEEAAAAFQRAERALAKQAWDEAIAAYTAVLSSDPQNLTALLRRGVAHRRNNEAEQALADFREAVKLASDSPLAHFLLAGTSSAIYAQSGSQGGLLDDASPHFNEAIRLAPHFSLAYVQRAAHRLALEDYDAGLDDCNRAAQIRPDQAFSPPEAYQCVFGIGAADARELRRLELAEISRLRAEAYYQRAERGLKSQAGYERGIADLTEAIRIKPSHVPARLRRANANYLGGDFAAAIADCTAALEQAPNSAAAYAIRGAAYLGQGDRAAALADCTAAIDLASGDDVDEVDERWGARTPAKALARWCRGEVQRLNGEYDAALEDCSEAIKLDGKSACAWMHRGAAYLGQGDYDKAVADLNEALRLDRKSAFAYWNRGEAHRLKGAYAQAISDCTRAIELDPKSASAYRQRGAAHLAGEDYDQALADLTAAIELDDKSVLAWAGRGEAYRKKGDYDRAIEDCTAAIRLGASGLAFLNRGAAHLAKGSYDEAITDLTQAIEFDPNSAFAYSNRGEARRMKGDSDAALADCTEAIRLDSNSALAYSSRGAIWLTKRDYDRAMSDLTEAIRLDPSSAFAYWNRGETYRLQGDYDKAIDDCNQAIRLDPQSAFAWMNRGDAHRMKGNYDQAIADADKAIELYPNSAFPYQTRGEAYRMKGDYERAVADCSQAIAIHPNYSFAYASRGAAYRQQGDFDRAIDDLSTAIRLDPNYAFAYDQRAEAYRARASQRRGPNPASDQQNAAADSAKAAALRGS